LGLGDNAISADSIVRCELRERLAIVTLNRPEKRNAFSAKLFEALLQAFTTLPTAVRAIVLAAEGKHFCAGLDLAEHRQATPFDSALYARHGHEIFNKIQYCGRPIVAAMQGAVIGGGFELICTAHVRVAERTAFYELPEGRRGIFLGGGGTVRIARLVGADRLTEMMLTGRRLTAEEGQQLGISHYLVEPGDGLSQAIALAEKVAANAQISNYMMLNAIPMIAQMPPEAGLFAESVAQSLTLTSEDAQKGMEAFLQKKEISF
jgi:(methylthio)acryloyl-CoA hydratase